MRVGPKPRAHLFVCANRREGSPLGPGCGERGDAVYDALKAEVARRGLVADVWVTRTHCLGICPKAGATVARYAPRGGDEPIVSEVRPEDAAALVDDAVARRGEDGAPSEAPSWEAIDRELEAIEALQRDKVLALARRLKPGLTLEDIQNPHDFPELDDPDWHYADGILTGIQTVVTALRAQKKRGA